MTNAELSVAFFLQMALIVAACRIVGELAKRFLGQPQVVGEMIAGIIIGPSLFGWVLPDLQATLFPQELRPTLYVGAQFGVGLYMFLVGLTFRRDHFRGNAASAASVSIAGMAAPFAVAVATAPWLLGLGLFGEGVVLWQAILFMGAAISITAFPMLARIIHERGLAASRLGSLALAAGAIDDVVAWCVLAIVLASFGAGPAVAAKAIIGGAVFAAFMLWIAPRFLRRLADHAERNGEVSLGLLAIVLLLYMVCAWVMDAVGVHAVFGGFILGVAMPRGFFANEIRKQLEPFTVVLLLPMFFTFSGLNTELAVVNSWSLAAVAAVIVFGSIAAKGVACWAAARLSGLDNPTAVGVGALMNARGLMELIIINIGLQHAIIGAELFAILVLMAIVTTLMASPIFELVRARVPVPEA
jgi:Kef-type K+ transport system membrane component KefB